MPLLCNYYVTLRCNSKCTFCNIWRNKDNFKLREQTLDEVEANLKDLKRLGVKFIDFTGGEPLLYHNIIEALKLSKKYGFLNFLTTNGTLYPQYAESLKGLVDNLTVSLDSPVESEHNKIRGIDCYSKVIESIKLAKKIEQKIQILYTVTNDNYKRLSEMVKFAEKNKCILEISPCFEYFGNEKITKEAILEAKKYEGAAYTIQDSAYNKFILDGGNKISNPVCKAVSSTIVISPDNYLLLPCYHHASSKIKIKKDLFIVYNSDKVKAFKKMEGRFPFCNNCTITCYMRTSLFSRYPIEFIKYSYNIVKNWLKR
jgi:MoaA/NifB/PqqE/SkfB family radical SAM enzyme